MKTAIAFLTREVKEETITFAYKLSQQANFDVYIIDDSECDSDIIGNDHFTQIGNLKIVKVSENTCKHYAYINSTKGTSVEKTPNAIDKFLYFFCEVETKYSNVWLIEDDVFVPSIESLVSLDEKYNKHDLVISKLEKHHGANDWNWGSAVGKMRQPFYRTMACCCSMSSKMLLEIKKYVDAHKMLFNSEIMWPTLARHANLEIFCPVELRSIVWKGDWSLDQILELPNNMYHPVKSLKRQEKLRELIAYSKEIEYEHSSSLPNFLKEHHVD